MSQQEARLHSRDGQDVAFLGCHLSGELRGLMFTAQVEQIFRNPGEKNIEVLYTFPLPWGAVLLGVDVVLGDRHLTGRVVGKSQAEMEYEEALSEGNAAIMLEQNADHSYCLNLGNLAAGEECRISLRYVQTLPFAQGSLRLLIPTVIAPRYGDAVQDGGLKPHQAPEYSLNAGYPFMLAIQLHGELATARIASPSHPVRFSRQSTVTGEVVTVSLARQAMLDRDFILLVDQLAHDAIAIHATDPQAAGSQVILASFCPRLATAAPLATNVKLLVDCSGSMSGDSLQSAQRALQAIVQQLDETDRFSLSRFGSTVEHRSRGLWKLTEITRRAAQRWINALEANLGGTEMEAALTSTFALSTTGDCDVLLVTDGEISAIDSTLDAAEQSGHRLFIVGIGSSPAETHLRRLAEASGGACDFVAPGEAVEPAVLRMFARLRSPRVRALSLAWPESMTPHWVSPLPRSVFDGDSFNVFAWLQQLPTGELRLLGQLSADGDTQEISTVSLHAAAADDNTLPRLAASIRCQTATETPATTAQRAIDYQLVTGQTHFLLVHERAEADKATDMPEQHKVRQMRAAGWGGADSVLATRTPLSTGIPPSICCAPPGSHGTLRALPQPPVSVRKGRSQPGKVTEKTPDPRHWIQREHYHGLSPLGLAAWLQGQRKETWPQCFAELQRIGVGHALLDWLELVIGQPGEGQAWTEAEIVATFCYLMAGKKIRLAAQASSDFPGRFDKLKALLASKAPDEFPEVRLPLLETMCAALRDIRADAWPEQVFALDAD